MLELYVTAIDWFSNFLFTWKTLTGTQSSFPHLGPF